MDKAALRPSRTHRVPPSAYLAMVAGVLALPAVTLASTDGAMTSAPVMAPQADLVVSLAPGSDSTDLIEDLRTTGLDVAVVEQVTDDIVVVTAAGSTTTAATAEALVQLDSIESADADPTVRASATPPNDPQWSNLWGMSEGATAQGIGLLDAWDVTRGSAGVIVAVIDTGIAKHPDLKSVLPGWDFVDDDATPTDEDAGCGSSPASFHGTHVAGTIGAAANNKVGVAGVAPNVRLLPVRVLAHCGSGSNSDVIAGILWAAGIDVTNAPPNIHPAKVINMSLGYQGACTTSLQNAIDAAIAKGVIVVAATGNAASTVGAPANCNGVIAVTAGQPDGTVASFSNRGSEATVMAPGTSITSTYRDTAIAWAPNKYGAGYSALQGTSMASPHAAGVAALLASVDPAISAATAKSVISGTARSHVSACSGCGSGLLDAGAAVASISRNPGALLPRDGDTLTLGAGIDVAWAGVSASKMTVSLEQGTASVRLAAASASADKASGSVPPAGKGIVAGPAIVRFTPSGALSGTPLPAPFTISVTVAAPAIKFTGPAGTLAYGSTSTFSWVATGPTNDKADLVLIDANGAQLQLKAGVRAQSGAVKFGGAGLLPIGNYTIALVPTGTATISTAARSISVVSPAITTSIVISSTASGSSIYVTARPGSVGAPVPFTILATSSAGIVKIGTVNGRAESGSQVLKVPASIAGKTATFSVIPAITNAASQTCTIAVGSAPAAACSSTPITF